MFEYFSRGRAAAGDTAVTTVVSIGQLVPIDNTFDKNMNLVTLFGQIVLSIVDLLKGYHYIPVVEWDIPKMAITT